MVELPPRHITLPGLRLSHPLFIKGTPGALVEFKNGGLRLAFVGTFYTAKDLTTIVSKKVIFSECSIVFNIDVEKWGSEKHGSRTEDSESMRKRVDGVEYQALVDIADKTFAEFRDCDIRAVISRGGTFIDDQQLASGEVQVREVCFWLNQMYGRVASNSEVALHDCVSTLSLKSCIFTHLYTAVVAGPNSTVSMDRCHFSDCRNDCIVVVNPNAMRVANCSISRNARNGVRVDWIKTSAHPGVARKVSLEGNSILNNGGSGLVIQSKKFRPHNVRIEVRGNKICQNKKEGVYLTNLAVGSLSLEHNEISQNNGSCVWIEAVHQKSNKYAFEIKNCRCAKSLGGFGLFLSDFGVRLADNVVEGNAEGGVMIKGSQRPDKLSREAQDFLEKHPLKVEMSGGQISDNGQNGIVVQEFWKGPVLIHHTRITANKQFGVYLAQRHKLEKRLGSTEVSQLGRVSLNSCCISLNGAGGMCVVKVPTEISASTFVDNRNFAINLPKESYKKYITMKERERVYEYIKGPIGGDWGICYNGKPGLCGASEDACRLL